MPLSIIIPTRGRLASLQQCLDSVFASELPEKFQLLVACNGSDPLTEDFLRRLRATDHRLTLLELDETSPAEARNAALEKAAGEIVYFLDDDVTVAPNLFSQALKTFAQRPEVDVLGGPNLTPAASPRFEKCVGYVLASPFGSASVCDRYRSTGRLRAADDRSLILCNLAIRRSALAKRKPVFGRGLVCNEENILLGRLGLEKRVMLHDPGLVVFHQRRDSFGGFIRQNFKYGRGRWQNTLLLPVSLSPVFLVPVFFLCYLLLLPFLRSSWRLVPLGAYLAMLSAFAALDSMRGRSLRNFPLVLGLFPACHLGYAAGFLWQLVLSMLPVPKFRPRLETLGNPERA